MVFAKFEEKMNKAYFRRSDLGIQRKFFEIYSRLRI